MNDPQSTRSSRFFVGIISGLLAAAFISVLLILPAMLIIWAVAGFPPARAWMWVGGTLAAAIFTNALRHAFFPRPTPPGAGQNTQGAVDTGG